MVNSKKLISSLSVLFLLATGFGAGFWYGQNSRSSVEKVTGLQNLEEGKPASVDFSLFWDAWSQLQEKFVNRGSLDYQKLVYGAISGMLGATGDPYTIFMTPTESEEFSQSLQGNLEGIGAEMGIRKNQLTVISPLENSPAKNAGIKAGDKILKVDDEFTAGMTLDEAVNKIRGPQGTEVRLTVARDGWEETKEFKITRAVIDIPIVRLEMKDAGGGKTVAYVSLYHFTENSPAEFEKAAREILTSGASGIILDLRGNPGGYIDAAVAIADWFLPKSSLVVVEDSGNGQKKENRTSGNAKLSPYETVVLIDGGSASASEILAGALRDNRGIKLVGEKSFGKGSVQQLEEMRGGGSLKITIARWLTPSGQSLMDEGLEPDVKVELTSENLDNGIDPPLEKALELFKEK